MSNVTPPAPAGALSETVNVNVVVPALVSAWVTSLIVRAGVPPPHGVSAEAVFRGFGGPAAKSDAF
jgi:hypothetical protein